jgi:hypothetical protein
MKTAIFFFTLAVAGAAVPAAIAQTATGGLTRAQVQAELAKAQAQGIEPTTDEDYPPSAAEIRRNRLQYRVAHGQHDDVGANDGVAAGKGR